MYAYKKYKVDSEVSKFDSRAKGLNKEVRKTYGFNTFYKLIKGEQITNEKTKVMNFRSINQELFTMQQEKAIFNLFDNKRFYINKVDSIPYGY